MSGVEIVGLVLGAFPLVISAMEHYEKDSKKAKDWWRIRRSYKKDLGKVKDCQLRFRLNLKELLLPLLAEDIVNRVEYEQLLANPGGSGWKDDHVESALSERLSDCRERYMEILEEMVETMAGLCKAAKVDDPQFQELLKEPQKHLNATQTSRQARTVLMSRANIMFQAKRTSFAFVTLQRDSLLGDVERYNSTLQDILAASDRINALTQSRSASSVKSVPKSMLQFWKHADCIFRMLNNAWQCQCRSIHCALLRLQQRAEKDVAMKIILKCSHDSSVGQNLPWFKRAVHVQMTDSAAYPSVPLKLGSKPTSSHNQMPSILVSHHHAAAKIAASHANSNSYSCTQTALKVSFAPAAALLSSSPPSNASNPPLDLKIKGLCKTAADMSGQACLGSLVDDDTGRCYTVSHGFDQSGDHDSVSLADVLANDVSVKLTRTERYEVASILASSFLQLQSTPWVRTWTSDTVRVPLSACTEPFIVSRFEHQANAVQQERTFSAFAVLLLELCFGTPISAHHTWQQLGLADRKSDPMIRQLIASEWSNDVAGEAG